VLTWLFTICIGNLSIYRLIYDLCTLLQEMISYVFMIKKVNINMGPDLSGYGVVGVF
jgi:hypothetical protein